MEDLSILKLRLECTNKEIFGLEKYKNTLIDEIHKHSKFKKGEILHVYTDPYNNNNPTWSDCEITSIMFNDNGLFIYDVCFTADHFEDDFEHAFNSFPEDELKKEYPWGKNKYKSPLRRA